MLEREYAYFKEHRSEFVSRHANEFVVIVGDKVLGFYKTQDEALKSVENQPPDSFFVKQCLPADQDIVEYHSRVVFA